MLGKIESRRRRGQQRIWLDGITKPVDMSLSKLRETVKDTGGLTCHSPVHGVPWSMVSQSVRHDLVTQRQELGGKITTATSMIIL